MHELQIAESLAEIVLKVAKREKLRKVTLVNIQFGKMIQIVPEIFQFAFQESVKGTIAKNSQINLEIMPILFRCNSCLKEYDFNEIANYCNNCKTGNLELINGKEMLIKSIEGE